MGAAHGLSCSAMPHMVQYIYGSSLSIIVLSFCNVSNKMTFLSSFRDYRSYKKPAKAFFSSTRTRIDVRLVIMIKYLPYLSIIALYPKEKQRMVCPQCGKDTVGNATFCSNCGSTLQPQPQLNTQYGSEGNAPPPPPEYMQNPYPYTPVPTPAPVPPRPLNAQNPYPYISTPVPPQPANMQNPYTPASIPQQPSNMQNPYPYMPAPPQSPKRKRGAVIAIVSVVVVLILISSIIGFAVSRQQSADHAAATSTAATGTAIVAAANAHTTATVVAQASATAQAKANPYSPTMPTLNSVTLTGPQDIANWDSNASCTYKQGYVISTSDGQLNSCNYNSNVGADYTAEVSV